LNAALGAQNSATPEHLDENLRKLARLALVEE
jgi:hypothetical protein